MAKKFKGQLKTFRVGFYKLTEHTVRDICYNCPNLEELSFHFVDTCDRLLTWVDTFGFEITSAVTMAFNSLRVLGLDYSGPQNMTVTLQELDIPSLRTLSLCNNSFVSKQQPMDCFKANSKLTIKVEDGKFNEQVLKEFNVKKYMLITGLPVCRKIPYYGKRIRSWMVILYWQWVVFIGHPDYISK